MMGRLSRAFLTGTFVFLSLRASSWNWRLSVFNVSCKAVIMSLNLIETQVGLHNLLPQHLFALLGESSLQPPDETIVELRSLTGSTLLSVGGETVEDLPGEVQAEGACQ